MIVASIETVWAGLVTPPKRELKTFRYDEASRTPIHLEKGAELGRFKLGSTAIVLFGPLLFPIAVQAGVHEVHYAMVVIFAMGIGLFAPPFGVGYYGACAISRVDPNEGIGPIWGYIAALLVGLIVVAAFPWFSIGFL